MKCTPVGVSCGCSEWAVQSFIRYIKVIGGPSGSEGMLCGLRSGEVVKVFLDNPFVIPVLKMRNPIRCLDISARYAVFRAVGTDQLLLLSWFAYGFGAALNLYRAELLFWNFI